ncbi:hypothetical protein JQX13_17070 [Archangium violaceum]|uniref:hypothetical protein n=1 Tax=Archangium violaceum TaxID=83451 RepID=UPI00193AEAA0|nr:hypothetical protein [Archangium violaceum]QRK11627.1 hypothetical protein JQX13_17070 [Archangium violaceum]
MAMTGMEALNRSQASAEAETGSIDSPVKECLAWIGVAAVYDDPWATPVTGCRVRIEVEGELVADGPRTKGLSSFGKEDGQPHDDVRAELGVYRQSGVKPGPASIALVPDGDDDPKGIEKQILNTLDAFETSMRQLLRHWIAEWSKDGWLSVPKAKRRGQLRGLGTWWEGEVDFWASVGDTAKEVWGGIQSGTSKVADWYEELPLYEQVGWLVAPVLMGGIEYVKQFAKTAQALWNRREQLMALLKAFLDGTAAAIENALGVLIDLPGELGPLIKDIVEHSRDWVQNMIEVVRETDVFKRVIKTIMTVVMMMTPNFWAEGIGMVEGYLLPEVLITIVLIIIGALCTAAGASALATRIAGVLSRLRAAISAAGKAGEVLKTLFSKLDEIARLVGDLSKALRRRINESVKGTTDKLNQLVRRSAKRVPARLDESMRHARPAEQRTAQRLADDPDFDGRTFKGIEGKDPGYDWVDDLGRKYDALGDGTKSQYMKLEQFTKSIDHHLLKGNDFTVVDMTGYTAEQIAAVKQYVDALPAAKQAMIVRVGF